MEPAPLAGRVSTPRRDGSPARATLMVRSMKQKKERIANAGDQKFSARGLPILTIFAIPCAKKMPTWLNSWFSYEKISDQNEKEKS
jgi:hypothetical protein